MGKEMIVIRRDTAIISSGLVKYGLTSLLGESVPVDTRLMSFDPVTPEGAKLLMSSENPTEKTPDQFYERPFNVQNWVAKAVDLPNMNTGKIDRAVRLTLIDDKGQCLPFSSIGAIQSMDIFRMQYGDGPYVPPIPVWVKQFKTRNKRSMYRLSLDAPEKVE